VRLSAATADALELAAAILASSRSREKICAWRPAALDENGLIDQAEVPMGELRITSRRAFVRGTP
jgi:hypothetical protein